MLPLYKYRHDLELGERRERQTEKHTKTVASILEEGRRHLARHPVAITGFRFPLGRLPPRHAQEGNLCDKNWNIFRSFHLRSLQIVFITNSPSPFLVTSIRPVLFQPFAPIAPHLLFRERKKKKENLIDFCQEGNERGSEERQIDKVWPFFTGVIIDAEPTRGGTGRNPLPFA